MTMISLDGRNTLPNPVVALECNRARWRGLGAYGCVLQGPGVVIRRVRAEEWRELRNIRLRALRDAPDAFETRHDDAANRPEEWWIDWAARSAAGDGQAMFLAWESNHPVGIVGTYVEDQRCWLISMWTDPSMRRRGVGAALVEEAARFARAVGVAELFLHVRFGNDAARHLYERCGFVDTGAGVEEQELKLVL